MSETPESNNPHPTGVPRQIAIVGLNRETATLLPSLLEAEGIQVIKVLNPDVEDLNRLTQYPHLSIIIDTTHNATVATKLRKLPLRKVEVITGLSARILFCSMRKSSEEEKDNVLRSLEEIRETVCLTKNKDEILKVILNTAVRTAGADCGSIMLLDPTKRHLTIEAAYGLQENVVASSIQRVGKGISGMAVRGGKPILIQGSVDRIAYGTDYQKPDIVSSICCPLLFGNEPVGVINISSKNPARVFNNADEDFLVKLSQLTAEVIITSRDNASNLQSTYVLGLLNNVREIFSMKYRFEERLNLLLMKMANAFEAKECTYYEFNPLDRGFMAKASSSIGMSVLKERPMRLDDTFAQRVLKTSNTICVNAAGTTHRSKKWCLLQPIRIGTGQDLVGTIFIYLQSEKNHLKEESVLLRKIGDMLARELSKNRDMEALKVQSLKYSAISQFSFDIANAKSLPDLTKMILSNVRLILESETCILRLRNSPTEALEVFESLSHKNATALKDILLLDECISASILPGKGAMLIPDLNHSEYETGSHAAESMLSVAIEIQGEVLGTLSLYDKKSMDQSYGTEFSEEDKEILLNFGLQVCKGLKRFLPFQTPAPKESPVSG